MILGHIIEYLILKAGDFFARTALHIFMCILNNYKSNSSHNGNSRQGKCL